MNFIISHNSFVNAQVIDLVRSDFLRGVGGIVKNMD